VPGSRGAATAGPAADPADEAVLADSVGLALLVVLDTLTPAERLAFVLHDLFAMPFTEVADVLGRSPDATRQLASRARRRVRGAPSPDRAADLARQREVAAAFLAASRGGDLSALVALLDSGVTLTADAAAVPSGRPAVLHGAEMVATGALAAAAMAGDSRLALVDGAVGIVFAPAGRLRVVLALTVSEARQITAIDVIAAPDRLRQLRLSLLPG
jgi:RNA polymerase sigma-70 factor (ECF subfamily)